MRHLSDTLRAYGQLEDAESLAREAVQLGIEILGDGHATFSEFRQVLDAIVTVPCRGVS